MFLTELKNIKTGKKNLRQFAVLCFFILMALGGWQLYQGNSKGYLSGVLGVVLGLFGSLWPVLLKPLYLLWMGLGVVLGNIVSRVILIITFYGVITPIGFVFRLFGKSFTSKKITSSYWVVRDDYSSNPEKYERQF